MLRRPKDHEGAAASWKITLAYPPLHERRIATGWLPHGESASDRAPTATSARWLVLGAGQAAGRDEPGAKFSWHRTDGPYAETKEHLAGFWIIDVADLDAALEWAKLATVAQRVPVEATRRPPVP